MGVTAATAAGAVDSERPMGAGGLVTIAPPVDGEVEGVGLVGDPVVAEAPLADVPAPRGGPATDVTTERTRP